jgi:hypothetical protein
VNQDGIVCWEWVCIKLPPPHIQVSLECRYPRDSGHEKHCVPILPRSRLNLEGAEEAVAKLRGPSYGMIS